MILDKHCPMCDETSTECICEKEYETRKKLQESVDEANSYIDEIVSISEVKKKTFISPQGHKCKNIRATENSITLLIYKNPDDPQEWTTNLDNFLKNYKEEQT